MSAPLAMLNIPARGSVCKHAQCFDLESYVSMNRKSTASAKNRWKCPLCWKSVPLESVIVDEFVETILEEARRNDDEEDEIECAQIDSSGKWKLVKFQSTPAKSRKREDSIVVMSLISDEEEEEEEEVPQESK